MFRHRATAMKLVENEPIPAPGILGALAFAQPLKTSKKGKPRRDGFQGFDLEVAAPACHRTSPDRIVWTRPSLTEPV
jgi:hypothetical protein